MALSLNYHHLYYFFAVAKSGSISKAASELSLTPPTLSSQLKQFQRSVKCRLFVRDGTGLKLTPEGRIFFKFAREMFSLGDQLESRVRHHGIHGHPTIQIGVPHGTPSAYTSALVNHILRHNSQTRVGLEEGALDYLTPKMGDLRLDFVLTTERVRRLEGVPCDNKLIGEIPIVFACRSSIRNGRGRYVTAKRTRFILPTYPTNTFDAIANLLNGVDPKEVCEVPNRDIALALALNGQGAAAVDYFSFNSFQRRQKLRLVRVDHHPAIRESVFLATAPRREPNPIADNTLRSFRLKLPTLN